MAPLGSNNSRRLPPFPIVSYRLPLTPTGSHQLKPAPTSSSQLPPDLPGSNCSNVSFYVPQALAGLHMLPLAPNSSYRLPLTPKGSHSLPIASKISFYLSQSLASSLVFPVYRRLPQRFVTKRKLFSSFLHKLVIYSLKRFVTIGYSLNLNATRRRRCRRTTPTTRFQCRF